MGLAIVWRFAHFVMVDPASFAGVVGVPILLLFLAAFLFLLGLFGWSVLQVVLIVLRLMDKKPEEASSKANVAFFLASIALFGIPEFAHAMEWWHEHLFHLIPHEEEAVAEIVRWVRELSKESWEAVLGWGVVAAGLTIYFVRKRERIKLVASKSMRQLAHLVTGPLWRVTAVLAVAAVSLVTVGGLLDSGPVLIIGAAAFLLLIGWLTLPFMIDFYALVAMTAFFTGPAFVLASPIRAVSHGWIPTFLAFFLILIAWPVGVEFAGRPSISSRILGWIGVLILAASVAVL
jgi:hypothetical protein